jgi:hypothetical protein
MPNFGTRTRPGLLSAVINDTDVVSVINSYLEPPYDQNCRRRPTLNEIQIYSRMDHNLYWTQYFTRFFQLQEQIKNELICAIYQRGIRKYNIFKKKYINILFDEIEKYHKLRYNLVRPLGYFLDRIEDNINWRLMQSFFESVNDFQPYIEHKQWNLTHFTIRIIVNQDYTPIWTKYVSTQMKRDLTDHKHSLKQHLRSFYRKG